MTCADKLRDLHAEWLATFPNLIVGQRCADLLPEIAAVIEAAEAVDDWNPQLDRSMRLLHPQHRDAVAGLRDALAALSARLEGAS